MGRTERDRLFGAVLRELDRRGFDDLAVADILPSAGISAAAFEGEFDDLDSCLFAAYEELTERLIHTATSNCGAEDEWPRRVRTGLEALLKELAAQPHMAQALTRSFPVIGPVAHLRYTEFLESFTPLLREGRVLSELEGEPAGELEMLAIGDAEALIRIEVEAGRASQLPTMATTILFSLLAPFLGRERTLAVTREEAELSPP